MYYFKLVTFKFDFKMDVANKPKSVKFPQRYFGIKKMNTGHSTRNGTKFTRGFTMQK